MPVKDFDEARWKEDSRIEHVPEIKGYYALGIVEVIYIGTNPPRLCSTTIRERVRSHLTNKDQQRLSRYLSGLNTWENIRIWWYETPRPCIEERRLVTEYKIIHDGYMPEFNELRVWNPAKCPECCSIAPTPMAPHLTTWQWKRIPQSEASTDGQVDYETIDSRRISNKRGIYAVGRVILFESALTDNLKKTMQAHLAGLPGSIVRIWWRSATVERPLQTIISRMTDSRHSQRISTMSLNSAKGAPPKPGTASSKSGQRTSTHRPPDDVLTMSRTSSVSSVDRKRQNSMPVRVKGGRVVEAEDGQLRGRQNSLPAHQRGRRNQRAESRAKEAQSDDELSRKHARSVSERSLPDTKAALHDPLPPYSTDGDTEPEKSRHSSTRSESTESSDTGRPSLSKLVKAEVETINVAALLRPVSIDPTEPEEVPVVQTRNEFISELRSAQRRLLGSSVYDDQPQSSDADEVFDKPPERPPRLRVDAAVPSTSHVSPMVESPPPPIPAKGFRPSVTSDAVNVLSLPERTRPAYAERNVAKPEPLERERDTKPRMKPDGRPDSMRELKPQIVKPDPVPRKTDQMVKPVPVARNVDVVVVKPEPVPRKADVDAVKPEPSSPRKPDAPPANGRIMGRRELLKLGPTVQEPKKATAALDTKHDSKQKGSQKESKQKPAHADSKQKTGKDSKHKSTEQEHKQRSRSIESEQQEHKRRSRSVGSEQQEHKRRSRSIGSEHKQKSAFHDPKHTNNVHEHRQRRFDSEPKLSQSTPIGRPETPDSLRYGTHRPGTPDSTDSFLSFKQHHEKKKQKPIERQLEKEKNEQLAQAYVEQQRKQRLRSAFSTIAAESRSLGSDIDGPPQRQIVQYRNKKTGRIEMVDITDVNMRKRQILQRREAERYGHERKDREKADALERRKAAKMAAEQRLVEERELIKEEKRLAAEKKKLNAERKEMKKETGDFDRKNSMRKSKSKKEQKSSAAPQNDVYTLKSTRSGKKDCVIS